MVVTQQLRCCEKYLLEKVAIGEVLSAHTLIEKDPDGDLGAFGGKQSWFFVFIARTARASRLPRRFIYILRQKDQRDKKRTV